MEPTSHFNIWLLTSVTDADKDWLSKNNYLHQIERTGLLLYMGEECLILRPDEKYVGFILLKFGNRLKPFPLEQYMTSDIIALYKV